MPDTTTTNTAGNGMWLKVLLGVIVTLVVAGFTVTERSLDKKLDKSVFDMNKEHEVRQFGEIKASLLRIENELKKE